MLRISDILVRIRIRIQIRIRGSVGYLLLADPDSDPAPDPASFVSDLQDGN